MKFWSWKGVAWVGLWLSLACALAVPPGTAKPIRLRNQVLLPAAAATEKARATTAEQPPASGLWLIQFRDAPRAEWREQLRALGVELLRYVPEDAFVARAREARIEAVRALDFIAYVGEYRPEHKFDARLREIAAQPGPPAPATKSGTGAAPTAPGQRVEVSVLLAPALSEADTVQVQRRFTRLRQQARLRVGRVLRGELPAGQLDALAADPGVLWIEPAPKMRLFDEVASRIVGGDGPTHQTLVQSLGYDGSGVTVAVADSGLDSGDTNSMHPDIAGRVVALFYYGSPGHLSDAADEHGHGTHVAGIIAGDGATGQTDENGFLYGLGVAPGVQLIGQRIFDGQGYFAEPPSFETLTRDAKRAGADIGSNSWGEDNNGYYDLAAMEFDELVRDADALTPGDQPYILEFSAGNSGPADQTIATPAAAKNVIATGASQNDRFNLPLEEFAIYAEGREAMADFSSRGPCADGRIKPDLVAPGTWIASLRSVFANDDFAWWPISQEYSFQGGTSQAGPHVSGAAAVFVQYWRSTRSNTPSPALVKAALIHSATDMDGLGAEEPVPNMAEGWGRVNLPELIVSARDYDFTDQAELLTQGGVFERRVLVGSSAQPLKVTLAWTDVPGFPAAGVALVNDLDLEVISPDGHLYRGNQFDGGESVADPPAADTLNNVEGIFLSSPVPGEYLVRVRAARVVEDARVDTGPVDQDFALVISGSVATPGVGIITFDRRVYRAPDRIGLTLVDYDLAGQAGVTVLLRSDTEPAGEPIELLPAAPHGVFTGAVMTATGPAAADGRLQLTHGDRIEAVYADAHPASNRVFTALADLQPPLIFDVWGTNRFGQSVAGWNTDEPARAEIYYGVLTPNHALTNRLAATAHEFVLSDLGAAALAKFFAVAQDEAGNRATNNNAGVLFTITNAEAPPILLVDSFADFYVLGFLVVAAPPLSGYTDALDQLGVSYEVFDARSNAVPTAQQLQAHRCVIWRMSDLEPPPPALVLALSNYVHSGGSLLLASMEAPTRLTEAGLSGFLTNTLHVLAYTEDQPVDWIMGVPGEPLGNGIYTALDYTPYEPILELANTSDPSDWIVADTNAAPILTTDGAVVGLRAPRTGVDLPGRVVFLSFPLDAVPLEPYPGNNRSGLLQNILKFLAPQTNSSLLTLDSDAYTLPGRAVVEVEDADQRGQGQLTVRLSSLYTTNRLDLPLFETVRPGLFRGSVLFVPTNSPVPNTFVTAPDEILEFDYLDESAGQWLSAWVRIDTNAPVISGVELQPGYLEAFVRWSTAKPADSLVQYSESPDLFPVNFTAYNPSPVTSHQIFLSGLRPSTTYYLRITSRDRAGNTATDDNNGALYSFTTLTPLTPPWYDDAETNSSDWTVVAPPESETQWQRGAPGGGENAHSGANCWGSNLSGGPVGQLETYLISPGILLSGGTRATLRFWHNYNFLQIGDGEVQLAALMIITNVLSPPQLLAQMPEDASGGWEEYEFDLTPYLGKLVYLVWYHFLIAFDAPPRIGWLVDDVSVTVENIPPGTVRVTNNLFQATFALAGPVGRTGNGTLTLITNAPPGEYRIQFGEVPFYITPPPQTNTLAPGGELTFNGFYTFPDTNANDIPDGWELLHFGQIAPGRTRDTDTDGDGMSDWAEFVAGTDPTLPAPPLRVNACCTNGLLELTWPTRTNYSYRVLRADLMPAPQWHVQAAWQTATSGLMRITLPLSTNAPAGFFRVEAAPLGPGPLADTLRVSTRLLFGGQIRVEWPSAPGHGYRLLSSTNAGASWTPASAWLRASGYSSGLTLPRPTNDLPVLFRVEAAP